MLIALFILALNSNYSLGQECTTQFTSHQTGAVITAYPVSISGTARRPTGGHVWILAHLRGFNDWYPQGNGGRTIEDANWDCTVYLGTQTETGYYEIAIAVVNDAVNQSLNNWVSTAKEKGYPPIPFPSVLRDCAITKITVEKR
jgi:hypothetical protein